MLVARKLRLMTRSLQQSLLELVAPLMLAAYAAWATVWLTMGSILAANDIRAWTARASMIVFLLAFMLLGASGDQRSDRTFAWTVALLAAMALTVCALAPQTAAPTLLILTVSMFASRLRGRVLWLSVGALNTAFAIIIFTLSSGQPRWIAVSFIAYLSFQMFAALVMQTARRAEVMSEELRAVNADLIATRSLLAESARDAERLRLSRELHDVAGHALTALKLNLGVLARDPRQPDAERVSLCAGLADDLLQNLRGVVRQMREHEGIDLRDAIERLATPFPKPSVHIDIDADARLHSIELAEALLRTVQEGLTNAARHAAASQLWLRLQRIDERIVLSMRDDGRGAHPLRPGHGLRGMRERLLGLGGELSIDNSPEGGLRLTASLPASRA